jgi:signal transduction histidine kinase
MRLQNQPFDIVLFITFFVYGLAFWGMGLTLALESGRPPGIAEARVLRPLAVFGFIHGTHEWLESYLLQGQAAGTYLPQWLEWVKLSLLFSSYISLLLFGLRTFRTLTGSTRRFTLPAVFVFVIYTLANLASAFVTYRIKQIIWPELLDAMMRYLLAFPAALLAAFALRTQMLTAFNRGDKVVARALGWAAVGFAIYGLTHFFVHPLEMFPARYINTESFRAFTGFPIQIIRTLVAVLITVCLLRASQVLGKERQRQLDEAQQSRLDALERVRETLVNKEELRRELLRHIVQAQEDERARIARELHDETAQTLAAFSLDLAAMQTMTPGNPDYLRINTRLQDHCKEMSRGLYRLVHDLRPAQLDDLGLVSALQYLADQDARANGLDVSLEIQGHVRRLDVTTETVLFRVTQEALSNILRHAQTKEAWIKLDYQKQDVVLTITDRGKGFDSLQVFLPPAGWGLAGMKERVEAVGGQLTIESAPGKGCVVRVAINVFDIIP